MLTIYYKNNKTKHVIRLTKHFLFNEKGRKCSLTELEDKAKSIGLHIAGNDYLKHDLYLEGIKDER